MTLDETRDLGLEPDRSSRHSVGIHASPAEVYLALTDPKELSRWFVSEASIDLRPGGSYRWVFGEATGSSGSDAGVGSGVFVALRPQESLNLRALVQDTETDLEFRLDPWRDGTVLTVTHSGFPGEEDWDDIFRSIDQGWESEIQVLKIYLERARGMVRRSIFHEARLETRAEEIFERFASASGLSSWLAERAGAEATLGGDLRLEWNGRAAIKGHYVVWDPDRFLVMTWEEPHPSCVRVWLEESEDGLATDLSLEHRLFAPDPRGFAPFDWDGALARLAAAVRSAPSA
ncbi:MAG TPA: SRPBCC family protein [Candidatus Polarisedimenticolia bacterium]|nr:SRPBCC family protein [Candidatus Polarisedimenticolia bacterium]